MRWRAVRAGVDWSAWSDCSKRPRIAWMFCFWESVVVTSPREGLLSRHIWSSWHRRRYPDLKAKATEVGNAISTLWHCLYVPLTTLWSEPTAPWSSITFVIFWSREDLVVTGRAESSWKCLSSSSSSAKWKKNKTNNSKWTIYHSPAKTKCCMQQVIKNWTRTAQYGLTTVHWPYDIGQSTC